MADEISAELKAWVADMLRMRAEHQASKRDQQEGQMNGATFDFTADIIAEDLECDARQQQPSAGHGGKLPSKDESRQSTRTSPTRASSRSAASPTASGRKALSFQPASGGSRGKSILTPANSPPTKSAAPKSMAGQQTPGVHGHG